MTIGNFYFEQTENLNLLGEYTNTGMRTIDVETANVLEDNEDSLAFSGKYQTVWFDDVKPVNCILDIIAHETPNKYKLTWTINNRVLFTGEGFVRKGVLMGFYRSVDK